MSLRDTLKTEKAKQRYDRNFSSVETTFSQNELEEHDKEIKAKAIDKFAQWLKRNYQAYDIDLCLQDNEHLSYTNSCIALESYIDEIAEQMKEGAE